MLATAGTFPALAGCSAIDSLQENESEPIRLGNIGLVNEHRNPHELSVIVRRGQRIVFWEAFELAAFEGDTDGTAQIPSTELDCTAGQYQLDVRLDNGERLSLDPNEPAGNQRLDGDDIRIIISEQGTLGALANSVGPNHCATTTAAESDE